MSAKDMRMKDEGDPLPEEEETDDLTNLTFDIISKVIGKNFAAIELEEQATRYQIE